MAASLRQFSDLGGRAAEAVTLADLSLAFDHLAPDGVAWGRGVEPPPIAARRLTCGTLADVAATLAGGRPAAVDDAAVNRYRNLWATLATLDAGSDPRLSAMRSTARREAIELGCVSTWC